MTDKEFLEKVLKKVEIKQFNKPVVCTGAIAIAGYSENGFSKDFIKQTKRICETENLNDKIIVVGMNLYIDFYRLLALYRFNR
jgi:hypothetical protein